MDLVYRLAINSCEPYEMQGKSNKNAHGLRYWDLVIVKAATRPVKAKTYSKSRYLRLHLLVAQIRR